MNRISLRTACFALLLACCTGCASQRPASQSQSPLTASNLPDRFLVGSHTDPSVREEPKAGGGCRNPLVDPQDGGRLILVRSAAQLGDYQVPAGRYNVGQRELLRIDCATGRAVGIVRR